MITWEVAPYCRMAAAEKSGAGGNRTRVQNSFQFTSYVACPYLIQRAGCPQSFLGVAHSFAPRRAFTKYSGL